MKMKEVSIEELLDWLSNEVGFKVTEKTNFIEDLGYDDLDLIAFFENFFSKFNVDSGDLNLDDYSWENISFIDSWFRRKKPKSFDVYHLQQVILHGKWFDRPN